ncbi:MAG: hypothetical protein Q8Q41_00715 [bacterium]|nr:hypothetical protein [bacterium]
MTKDKVRQVIGIYRRYFESRGIGRRAMPHDMVPKTREEALEHCHSMLDKMEEFVNENRLDKAFRWLGFIQGCLWVHAVHTLDELMDHNRPREGD